MLPLLENPEADWPERTIFLIGVAGAGEVGVSLLGRKQSTMAHRFATIAGVWSLKWIAKVRLSDILTDPGETTNLIQAQPEVAEMLKQQYDDWWDSTEPYLVNEGLPRIAAGKHHLQQLYDKQVVESGIPDWEPASLKKNKNKQSDWSGYRRINFEIDTRPAWLVKPNVVAQGKPWVWRARFPKYHTEVDLLLLERGFHLAYINTDGMLGSPKALKHWDAFYAHLTSTEGLSKKVALEAVSRGGLFAYRWAAQNPDSR